MLASGCVLSLLGIAAWRRAYVISLFRFVIRHSLGFSGMSVSPGDSKRGVGWV